MNKFLIFYLGYPDIKPFERVVIGGGDLGLMLASVTEKDFDCVLLELDESRALACSAALDSTLVLQADALTESAMEEAGITIEPLLLH